MRTMTDEDETIVLKNTGLLSHLHNAGFHDFEVVEEPENFAKTLPAPQSVIGTKHDWDKMLPLQDYQEFEKLLHIVLESHLVFNDDVLFVKNFAVHMKPLSKSTCIAFSDLTLETLFISTSCLACTACGVKLKPWVLLSLHIIPFSIHTIKHLYQTYFKRKKRKILERSVKNLKKLSLLLQKSIQFVYENEVLAYGGNSPVSTEEDLVLVGELQAMQHLRMSIFHAIRSAVLDFKSLIINLMEKFPLKSHVSALSYHLAFLDEIDLQCAYTNETSVSVQQLQKMKYVLLLLQSEFLRQLCLCFVPSLWICNTDVLLKNVFSMLTDFGERCSIRYQQLKSIFEIYYTCEKPRASQTSSPDTKWQYKEAYVKSCSLSFNLQSVLKNSRLLEEFLEDTRASDIVHEKVIQRLDTMSEQIGRDYARCQKVLDDLRRYVISLKPKTSCSAQGVEISVPETSSVKTNILLGVTDFTPMWPDEVFVGVPENEKNVIETEAVSIDEDRPQPPKLFISELKGALQSKAKEWKEREKMALRNKNIDTDDEEQLNLASSSSEEELSSIHKQTSRIQESAYKFKPIPVAESSFAKKIQEASVSWGIASEEFLGDDAED